MVVLLDEGRVVGAAVEPDHKSRNLRFPSNAIDLPVLGQSENLNILPGGFFSGLLARHRDSQR
jgi:hypothetical protein